MLFCLVDGGWLKWSYDDCSITCGGGSRKKSRFCNNPAPSCGGKKCNGLTVEIEKCNEFPC